MTLTWFHWAVLSAVFAALMTIFAKVGLPADLDSTFATLIRTGIVLVVTAGVVMGTGKWQDPSALSGKTWLFLTLSALATGASWLCYFRALQMGTPSQVAPIDKASLLLVVAFGFIFLKDRPSAREWVGILMVGAGVVVIGLKPKGPPAHENAAADHSGAALDKKKNP